MKHLLMIAVLGVFSWSAAGLVSSPPTEIPEESIYNMNSELLSSEGKTVNLSELRGQPVVISMAYTGCVYACPLILSKMQEIEKELKKDSQQPVFVLISFDPQGDTPEVLKQYAVKRKLGPHWRLYTAKADKAPREIAALLGIKYKKIGPKDFDHSFIITALNSEGVIRGQLVGADKDPKDLIKFLKN